MTARMVRTWQAPLFATRGSTTVHHVLRSLDVSAYPLTFLPTGNSRKEHNNQPLVANDIVDQLCAGEQGIVGVMIESNLCAGSQKVVPKSGLAGLKRGVSITDACIDWNTTVDVLRNLARGVRERRKWTAVPA